MVGCQNCGRFPRGAKYVYIEGLGLGFRVQVPNNLVLGFWAIVVIVQVLGKYVIVRLIRYLDP